MISEGTMSEPAPTSALAGLAGAPIPGSRAADPQGPFARFCARLDGELAALPVTAHAALLRTKLAWWEGSYRRFVRAIDTDEHALPPDGPDILDYLLVMSEISVRLGRIT
jgi:hypothetical protein